MLAAALSLIARSWLLGRRPLWHDEVFTIWISRLSPGEIVRSLRSDSGPPAFYLLQKPIVAAIEAYRLADQGVRALSFLAAAFLFAGAWALSANSRRRFLWLAAASPVLLLYSGEARAYSVLALLAFVLFRLSVRGAPGAGRVAAIAVTAAALAWTHYLGLFVAGSLLAATLAEGRRRAAAAVAAGLALFLPWAPVVLAQPAAATGWLQDRPTVSVGGFLASLGGAVRVLPPFGRPLPQTLSWLAGAAGIVLVAILLARRSEDGEARIALATVLLTLAGLLVVSFWRPAAVAGRSEMAVLPIWLWLAARSGETSRIARGVAAAVVAIGILSSAWILASPRSPRPFAEVPARLLDSARSGDLVVASGNFYLPARLALERGVLAARLEGLPRDLQDHPGWFRGEPAAESDYRRLSQEFSAAGPGRAIFLLLDPLYWTSRMREILSVRGSPIVQQLPRYGLLVSSPASRAGGM